MISNRLCSSTDNLNTTSDIYEFLGTTLAARIPKSVIIVVQLDVTLKAGYVFGFYGLNMPWFNKLISVLGLNPVGKHFDITEDGRRYYYTDTSFRKFNGTIFQFAGGQIPEWVTKSVEKLFGIQSIYTIALNHAKKPMGTVLVFNRQPNALCCSELEAFVGEVSKQLYKVIKSNIKDLNIPTVKDEFTENMLSNLSHEIRTPLNGIMGMLELAQLEGKSSNAIDVSIFEHAWSSARALTKNIDSLVLASELATQSVVLAKHCLNTNQLIKSIETIIDRLRLYHVGRDIQLRFSEFEDRQIYFDSNRFDYIVDELVTNALKFSDEQVEVHVSFDSHLCFNVRDYGIGLTDKELEVVYEHFAKVAHPNRLYRGMGLGLYNCHQLVKMHGGSLHLFSKSNQGTLVEFKVPAVDCLSGAN
jgi:signal transduction histidine kinase